MPASPAPAPTLASLAAQLLAVAKGLAALDYDATPAQAAAPVGTFAPPAPVVPVAAAPVSTDGRIWPCTAAEPCGFMLRSEKRAAVHGVEAGGHDDRIAAEKARKARKAA